MHDIKFIRENPEIFDEAMLKRGEKKLSIQIVELDSEIRKKKQELQELQNNRNQIAKTIGQAKAKGENADESMKEAERIKSLIPVIESEIEFLEKKLKEYLITLPNIPDEDVPQGENEESNLEIRKNGNPAAFDFAPKHHFELGEELQQMDFKQAAKISGSRFVILKNDLAMLERALANFMLDIHTQSFEYTEVSPPLLVREEAMFGVGQLPKFEEDSFKTTNGYRLIPTSEVSLANMVADSIIPEEELPLRFTAHTACFRSEAGSAGKDTRGMFRQHQFSKVELVSVTHPKHSASELERMTGAAEEILKQLDLPYRVILLCSGDMGFSARKTYDIEVWLPAQKKYREISSCSNCHDFQARRMKARFKDYTTRENSFVHTLNGSGLAIGRTIIAVLEKYQNEDGSIAIPEKLQQYMNGRKIIEKA